MSLTKPRFEVGQTVLVLARNGRPLRQGSIKVSICSLFGDVSYKVDTCRGEIPESRVRPANEARQESHHRGTASV